MKSLNYVVLVVVLIVVISISCGDVNIISRTTCMANLVDIEGSSNVPVCSSFKYIFDNAVKPSTVDETTFFIVPTPSSEDSLIKTAAYNEDVCVVDNAIEASVYCNPSPVGLSKPRECIIDPSNNLSYSTGYTACLASTIEYANVGGSFLIRDAFAAAGFSGASFSFTTASSGNSLTTPSLANIRTALGENNTYGMVPVLALGEITLPVCTTSEGSDVDFDVTYSVNDLPDWLLFDATTRAISLADDATTVPSGANTASEVTYICTDDLDSTVTASTDAFTINDLDGGGVIDANEYTYGAVPLLNNNGWFQLNPGNLDLYRVGTSSFLVPTGMTKVTTGMDPTDATDDTADFDGDDGVTGGGTNAEEITAGTNPMVYAGDGTFTDLGSNPPVSNTPRSLVAGDFNGDGIIDLAVARSNNNRVAILLGDGDGDFSDGGFVNVGAGPRGIIAADFDGDGDIDLAVANNSGDNLTVLLGSGDGNFTDSGENPITGAAPRSLVAADFNGDGNIDLATENRDDSNISIFLGDGDGTFEDADNYDTGTNPQGMTVADFDNDGDMDLAVSNSSDDDVSVLLGDGDGTFTDSGENPSTGSATPTSIAAADFDGDGNIDLAVPNTNDNDVSVLLGDGDGTFTDSGENPSTGTTPASIVATDFDGDGDIDLAVINGIDSDVSVFLGDGDGTFTDSGENPSTGNGNYDIVAADFDGDGSIDLAITNRGDGTLTILLGD